MRVGLLQLNATDDPLENLPVTLGLVAEAAGQRSRFVLTPEVTNCVSASRKRQAEVLQHEAEDLTLAGLRAAAMEHGIWLLVGSIALKSDDPEGRFVNRSFLIAPDGEIAARYDKMHMFDVVISDTETYRESAGYRPGDQAVLTTVDGVRVGLTVCYDLRFAYLYRALAQAGAAILTVPSAFSPDTGQSHWEPLLRARAIETGSYVLAPAQCGTHKASRGRARQTFGHSLAVSPWGEVLADGGTSPGVTVVDLDPDLVETSRNRVPSLRHDRRFRGP